MKQFRLGVIFMTLLAVALTFQNCAESIDLTDYNTTASVLEPDLVPSITFQTEDHTALVDEQVDFSVRALGTNLTFQWYKNNILLPGKTMGTISILSAKVADAGAYKVVVKNSAGSDEAIINLTVETPVVVMPVAPIITMQPAARVEIKLTEFLTASASAPLVRKFSVTATGATSYQWWYKANAVSGKPAPVFVAIPGATSATYTLTITDLGIVVPYGIYKVKATNSAGSVESNTGELVFVSDITF